MCVRFMGSKFMVIRGFPIKSLANWGMTSLLAFGIIIGWSWDLGVDENALVGEVGDEWSDLVLILRDVRPYFDVIDKVVWLRNVEGFLMKNSYMQLYALKNMNLVLDEDRLIEFNRMWKASVPIKVKFFGWRLLLNALPTMSELCNRGMKRVLSGSLCPLCDLEEESVGHLFSLVASNSGFYGRMF
ncbi:hypothetical protein KIW84_025476 [Lathyrus oleraceus]|uniref:Reverse transcriptase zinc-binding domain-containing protein n=1 Tax=Pisum sativum TaxID=3888 RepID=A0A9D4YJP0_PEA|nr:hypothetical protein KIW84_025476 [Pisum sativum]